MTQMNRGLYLGELAMISSKSLGGFGLMMANLIGLAHEVDEPIDDTEIVLVKDAANEPPFTFYFGFCERDFKFFQDLLTEEQYFRFCESLLPEEKIRKAKKKGKSKDSERHDSLKVHIASWGAPAVRISLNDFVTILSKFIIANSK